MKFYEEILWLCFELAVKAMVGDPFSDGWESFDRVVQLKATPPQQVLESKGYQQSEREPMICPETEVPCENNCDRQHRCDHWKDQGLRAPTKYDSKPTPTPSITVGTQVRLTGVVAETRGFAIRKNVGVKFSDRSDEPLIWFGTDEVEVIRQPFKRGEVVYGIVSKEKYVVVNDEDPTSGDVLIVGPMHGDSVFCVDPSKLERRP